MDAGIERHALQPRRRRNAQVSGSPYAIQRHLPERNGLGNTHQLTAAHVDHQFKPLPSLQQQNQDYGDTEPPLDAT